MQGEFDRKPGASTLVQQSQDGGASAPAPGKRTLTEQAGGSSLDGALDRKLASGGGAPLSPDVAQQAKGAYGVDMGGVRVHHDAESGAMADAQGFQAMSYGSDLFFKPGAYQPETQDGRFVVMHELAHVAQSGGERAAGVQGKAEVGSQSEPMEADADQAAAAAITGEQYTVQRAPLKLRGFGATAPRLPNGQRDRRAIVHENQTENAAEDVGFSDRDAEMIYSGNWQRDMNQFLIPKLREAGPVIFSAMDLLHTLHFGYPISGSREQAEAGPQARHSSAAAASEFGTYDPVEHIDNPGGLTGGDVNAQNAGREGDSALGSRNSGGDAAYAAADQRYRDQYNRIVATARNHEQTIENPTEANAAFRVDESGIPVYMQTSRAQLKRRLREGLRLYASDNRQRDRALRYSGEALHIMQDYYAHSNFCEVAINILLDSQFSARGQLDPRGTQSFEQVLGLSRLNPALQDPRTTRHHINSYVHRNGPGGADVAHNMTTRGGREVMATGTFTLEDTAHSIREKLAGAITNLNPFARGPEGPSEKTLRLITWFESNPGYFAFDTAGTVQAVAGILDGIRPALDALVQGVGGVAATSSRVNAAFERGAGAVAGAWHRTFGDENAAQASEHSHEDAAQGDERQARAREQATVKFRQRLDSTITSLAQGGSLRQLYLFAYDAGQVVTLANLARAIPLIGDQLADVVQRAVDAAKELIRSRMEAAWNATGQRLITEMNAAVALALGSSEVSDRTGAQTMTQPTHTDIAKDFDADQHGTEDRFSVIEEVGEFVNRVGGAGPAGQRVLGMATDQFNRVVNGQTGVIDGVRNLGTQIANEATSDDDTGHTHQHRHGGAWLAPLADMMATSSSRAILAEYHAGLQTLAQHGAYNVGTQATDTNDEHGQLADARVNTAATALDRVVDTYFAHPADCKPTWQAPFMAALTAQSADALAIRQELARRVAVPPNAQAPNDEATVDHHDRHGRHDHGDADHGDHDQPRPQAP